MLNGSKQAGPGELVFHSMLSCIQGLFLWVTIHSISGVPKVWQVWHVPWAPLEGGATEKFPLKSDKPSSDRFVDDFFATF